MFTLAVVVGVSIILGASKLYSETAVPKTRQTREVSVFGHLGSSTCLSLANLWVD